MGAATSLTFQIFGEDKGAARTLRNVGESADHTGEKLDDMGDKGGRAHGQLGKLGKIAGGALLTGIGAAAVAAGALTAGLLDAANGAAEDQASAARLAQQLQKTTGATADQVAAVEDWISAQGEAYGFADDQLRPAFQRLASSTKDVQEAQELATLAMDISAGTGKDVTTVAQALAKANDGNVGALKKLGVTLGDNAQNLIEYNKQQSTVAKAQAAYNSAVDEYGPKSKQAQDAQDKLATAQGKLNDIQKQGIDVMGELGKQFGGAASTQAETLSGRIGRLKLMFDETKETIGYQVLPIIEKLVAWFQDKALPVIGDMAGKIIPKLKDAFDSVKQTVIENKPELEKLGQIVAGVAAIIVEKVIPVLIEIWKHQLKFVIEAFAELGDKLPKIAKAFLDFSSAAVGALGKVWDAATDAFGGILGAAEKGMGWIPGIGDKLKNARDAFDDWKEQSTARIDKVRDGLQAAADKVDAWDKKASNASKADIKADISDLESKIATAKEKLAQKGLTEPEKAKIKADIDDLQEKVKAAKEELVTVKDRTVTVKVNLEANHVKFRAKGSGEDEPSGGGDDSARVPVSGAGVTKWTHGVGHPGAGWYKAGAWTWAGGHHNGVDVGGVGTGTRVYSTRSGVITHSGPGGPEGGWAGNNVIEDIGGGVQLVFAHLSRAIANVGAHVSGGDLMGLTGWSGRVRPKGPGGAHLHVSARKGGTYVNPIPYLAEGGVVRSSPGGTVVVAGEAGRDEAVIPLPSGWRSGDALGATNITINVTGGLGDREAVARDVRLALLDLKRRQGISLGLA